MLIWVTVIDDYIPKAYFSCSFCHAVVFCRPPLLAFVQDSYRLGQSVVFDAGWRFIGRRLRWVVGAGFAVYDTWSYHYENNGVNENRISA